MLSNLYQLGHGLRRKPPESGEQSPVFGCLAPNQYVNGHFSAGAVSPGSEACWSGAGDRLEQSVFAI
jgi:hypothetical protein